MSEGWQYGLGTEVGDLGRRFGEAFLAARARPDGAPFDDLGESFANLVSIGWIADDEQVIVYPRGKVHLDCLDRLRDDLSCSQPFPSWTKCSCKVCEARKPTEVFTHVSPGQIWVPGNGCIYVSPGNLVHLIYDHDYQPPREFEEAVRKAPRVGSLAFAHALEPSIDPGLYTAIRAGWEKRGPIRHDPQQPPCRYCDTPLPTAKAKQCFCCGIDWHHTDRILIRGKIVTREDILALFA